MQEQRFYFLFFIFLQFSSSQSADKEKRKLLSMKDRSRPQRSTFFVLFLKVKRSALVGEKEGQGVGGVIDDLG